MNTLVYLSPNTKEPFTTSKVIAEMTGIEHRKIKVLNSNASSRIVVRVSSIESL